MDRAIELTMPVFKKVWLRGDTDFSLTHNFDRWDERVGFVFGYDAKRNLIEMADALPESPGSCSNGLHATRLRPKSGSVRKMLRRK